jgi:hypothetical protein
MYSLSWEVLRIFGLMKTVSTSLAFLRSGFWGDAEDAVGDGYLGRGDGHPVVLGVHGFLHAGDDVLDFHAGDVVHGYFLGRGG